MHFGYINAKCKRIFFKLVQFKVWFNKPPWFNEPCLSQGRPMSRASISRASVSRASMSRASISREPYHTTVFRSRFFNQLLGLKWYRWYVSMFTPVLRATFPPFLLLPPPPPPFVPAEISTRSWQGRRRRRGGTSNNYQER